MSQEHEIVSQIREAQHDSAKADEFIAEMDDDGQVHIFDGEGTIRLSMPYDVWEAFTGDAIIRRTM